MNQLSSDIAAPRQVYLFNAFSLVACMALVVFGTFHLTHHDTFMGIVEIVLAAFVALNTLIRHWTQRTDIALNLLIFSVFCLLMSLVIDGGIEATGIFWFYMFPVAVFFMVGKRRGVYWVVLLYIGAISLLLFDAYGLISLPYSFVIMRQMLASLLVVSVLVYLYQSNHERDEYTIQQQEKRLETLYDIASHSETVLPDQIRAALRIGSETLHTSFAIISRIVGDQFTVLHCVVPPNTIHEGETYPLRLTYCDITVKGDDILVIDEMKTCPYKDHSCYKKFQLEAYIGVPIKIHGKLFGTLNFSSPQSHNPTFTESDRTFVRLMGQWIQTVFERQIAAEKALEVDKMKSEFVSLASHQLRTPLTGIKWFSELLLKGKAGVLAKDQQDFLQQIFDSNERMIKLVNDLLNVSRIETGTKFTITRAPVDIIPILLSLEDEMVALAATHKIEFVFGEQMPRQLILDVDQQKMRQVFQNLMSNAVKYSKAGGEVEIGIRDESHSENGGSLVLYIKDTGLGIPANQQSRVFEKLFRADNVQTAETDGTGLGLYIAKAIVEGHGGRLWFESVQDRGTTFFIQIPRS